VNQWLTAVVENAQRRPRHGTRRPRRDLQGLAIAQPTPANPVLYAADFHNARVDVFNGAWQNITPAGSFVDPMVPDGYAPFEIQVIGSRVFVSYAKQDADAADEVAGEGRGFVDVYDLGGNLLTRVAQHRRQLRRRADQCVRGNGRRLRAPRHVAGPVRPEAGDRRALGARVRERRA
jgi:hypothetical protein